MRTRRGAGGIVGLVVLALLVFVAPGAHTEETTGVEAQAYILFARGGVAVRFAGGDWQSARAGHTLPAGTEVRVGQQAYAELAYDRAHTKVSRLDQEGIVTILEAGPQGVRVQLQQGRLFNLVAPLSSGEHFIVQTPEAVASVRGTAFEGQHTDHTQIKVFDLGDPDPHAVAVQAVDAEGRPVGEERLLREGEKSIADAGQVRDAQPLSADEQREAQERLQEVEQRVKEAAPVEGAQQAPPGGPPPGAPPAGLADAPWADHPTATPAEVSLRQAMPDAPPMDEEHIRAMADVLGVTPEQFTEMSPRDMTERIEGAALEHPERMERAYVMPEPRDRGDHERLEPERMEREDFRAFQERQMERPDWQERATELRQDDRETNLLPPPVEPPPATEPPPASPSGTVSTAPPADGYSGSP